MLCKGQYKLGNESHFIFTETFLKKKNTQILNFSILQYLSWESETFTKIQAPVLEVNMPMNHKIAFKLIKISSDLLLSVSSKKPSMHNTTQTMNGWSALTTACVPISCSPQTSQGEVLATSCWMLLCSEISPRCMLPTCTEHSGRSRINFRDICSILEGSPTLELNSFSRLFTIKNDYNANAGWSNILEYNQ